MSLRFVTINSILAYCSASIFSTIIHESGHFLTALSLDLKSCLYHNYVESSGDESFFASIMVPAGGPVISILTGILFIYIYKWFSNSYLSLFTFWLGIKSILGFLGYLMIAPFIAAGDTGKIFSLLEIPIIWQLLAAVIGLGIAIVFLLRIYKGFELFIAEEIASNEKLKRSGWTKSLIMYPLFIGIPVTTLVQFPIPHIVSILPSLMLPFSLFMTFGKLVTAKDVLPLTHAKNINDLSYLLILFALFALIVNRVLVFGLEF